VASGVPCIATGFRIAMSDGDGMAKCLALRASVPSHVTQYYHGPVVIDVQVDGNEGLSPVERFN
jgi:hypothetical protein